MTQPNPSTEAGEPMALSSTLFERHAEP